MASNTVNTNLVLQSMSSALHVHYLRIRICELAVAQLAVEADRRTCLIASLLDVLLTCWQFQLYVK